MTERFCCRTRERYAAWKQPFLALDAMDAVEANDRRLAEYFDAGHVSVM
jgi:hypothetical protein